MTPAGHSAAMIAVADARARIAANMRAGRRERPSRVASVGQDPIRPFPTTLSVFRRLNRCPHLPIDVGARAIKTVAGKVMKDKRMQVGGKFDSASPPGR
jgi:hypothetical protein